MHVLRTATAVSVQRIDPDGSGDEIPIIRVPLAPSVAKPVVAAVDELVRRIAATPPEPVEDVSADALDQPSVVADATVCGEDPSAGASGQPTVSERPPMVVPSPSRVATTMAAR